MNFKVDFIENTMIVDVSFGEIQKVGSIEDIDIYEGTYDVVPSTEAQTLPTAQTFLTGNVEISAIPYAETSNTSGGTTVTIG